MERGMDGPEKSARVPVGEPAGASGTGSDAEPAAVEMSAAAQDTETAEEAVAAVARGDTLPGGTGSAADRGDSEQNAASGSEDAAAPDAEDTQAAVVVADTSADRSSAAGGRPGKRMLTGEVVSDKAEQSIVVSIAHRKKHRLYKKYRTLTKKLMAHDPDNSCRVGDLVRVIESRPVSRRKRWRVVEVVKRATR